MNGTILKGFSLNEVKIERVDIILLCKVQMTIYLLLRCTRCWTVATVESCSAAWQGGLNPVSSTINHDVEKYVCKELPSYYCDTNSFFYHVFLPLLFVWIYRCHLITFTFYLWFGWNRTLAIRALNVQMLFVCLSVVCCCDQVRKLLANYLLTAYW